MNYLRQVIASLLGIPLADLGCFTLTDHDGQPAILIVHGMKHQGIYIESTDKSTFVLAQKTGP